MGRFVPGSKSYSKSCGRIHINTVVFLTILCFSVYIIYGYHGVYGAAGTSGGLQDMLVAGMPMVFTALVGMSCAPFLTLLIFSGAGNLLNTGLFSTEGIPFADILMGLPISETNVFVVLLVVTSLKIFVSLVGTGKIICDISVGRIEDLISAICVIGGPYLVATSVTVQGASLSASGGSFFASGAAMLLSVIIPIVAYGMYYVMKNLALAIDIAAFLASPIPGMAALFTIAKHMLVGTYVGLALINPTAMTVVGLIFFVVAVIVFNWARRLVRYYRKIYLVAFFNSIFRAGRYIPLVPARLPRRVAAEFKNVEICIPAFVMNRTPHFKKRDRCYLIRTGNVNYLYAGRLVGEPAKMVLPDDIYIEKLFRFVRFSSDRHLHLSLRGVHVVISREHATNIEALVQKAGFTHYDEPPRPGGTKVEANEPKESKWKPRRRS